MARASTAVPKVIDRVFVWRRCSSRSDGFWEGRLRTSRSCEADGPGFRRPWDR